ncbi:MAG: hypothetical protein IJ337_03025, partial [Clostridia bacterium]|nr:hypothetical protein [Clostridia bacterium]
MSKRARDCKARCLPFVLLFAAIFALMLCLNAHTPLLMDDFDYSFSWSTGERLDGIADILHSQAAHYMIWGGRSVTHFLAQLFLYLGKPVFNAANALMYVLLLLEIYALARRRETAWDWRLILVAHLLLFAAVEFFGVAFLWLDGACNYLWGTAIALWPLLISRSEREGGFFDSDGIKGWLALPLCFIAGWTNENTACGILAAMLLLLVWDVYRSRKIRLWRIFALVMQAAGVAIMLLAPGNYARASDGASRPFVMEMLYRCAVVAYCTLRYAGIPLLLAAIEWLIAVKKKAPLRLEWLCVLFVSAAMSAGALIGSPQISDRSFTAVIVLIIAALLAIMADKKPKADRHSARVAALLVAAAGLLGGYACARVMAHEAMWTAQIVHIEQALASDKDEVTIRSVPSLSRYTMA